MEVLRYYFDLDLSEGIGNHVSLNNFTEQAQVLCRADSDEVPPGLAVVVMFQTDGTVRSMMSFYQFYYP
ncbi:hypothetical protein AY600_11320 [Phormidium willei BDU 130791]|nr:hypothetical protein AY600_11320 [Phormidium willei BDU 130791]